MERFVKGEVVVIPFPFSNISGAKRRPAMVISVLKGSDIILCQITSRSRSNAYSIKLYDKDFITGELRKPSNIRPDKIFTADSNIIRYSIGKLRKEKIEEVISKIIEIIQK